MPTKRGRKSRSCRRNVAFRSGAPFLVQYFLKKTLSSAQNLENKRLGFFLPRRSMVLKVVTGKIFKRLELWRLLALPCDSVVEHGKAWTKVLPSPLRSDSAICIVRLCRVVKERRLPYRKPMYCYLIVSGVMRARRKWAACEAGSRIGNIDVCPPMRRTRKERGTPKLDGWPSFALQGWGLMQPASRSSTRDCRPRGSHLYKA
jgi:hypothetical protein